MKIGEKIYRIRTFRNMSQRELGEAVGFGAQAQVRIAHYESGFRTPKADMVEKLAKALNVHPYALEAECAGSFMALMEALFWADEEFRIRLARMKPSNKKYNSTSDLEVEYTETDDWYVYRPTAMWFNGASMDDFMQVWEYEQRKLFKKVITEDEYFEWKINWPTTGDITRREMLEVEAEEREQDRMNMYRMMQTDLAAPRVFLPVFDISELENFSDLADIIRKQEKDAEETNNGSK